MTKKDRKYLQWLDDNYPIIGYIFMGILIILGLMVLSIFVLIWLWPSLILKMIGSIVLLIIILSISLGILKDSQRSKYEKSLDEQPIK